jgi:cobalt-zinc-cadmium efflux system protein
LSTTNTALTPHVVRQEGLTDRELIGRIARGVHARFDIDHATVQLESPEMARSCSLRPDHTV